ncbi:hypothetical protein Tco_0572866 [Tanacetum coccineum]
MRGVLSSKQHALRACSFSVSDAPIVSETSAGVCLGSRGDLRESEATTTWVGHETMVAASLDMKQQWYSIYTIKRETGGLDDGVAASFQLELDSSPHAHTQTTKTYYKHQDSRIKKAQELKTKTSANSDIKDNFSEIKLRGRLLESFQDDAKYEHVGKDTRSQDGKDDQDKDKVERQ